jgi:light-regulated signal transduction histidine kinase (bacteriophytochrome)
VTDTFHDIEKKYKAALREHLARPDEDTLFGAYQLGHDAIARGMGVLEIADIHQRALVSLTADATTPDEITAIFGNAHAFYREILSSFEMIHRGFRESTAAVEELEQRIQQRTSLLQETNKELDTFSYSVAHDLRAPLRAIDGFTRLLQDDFSSQLSDEGRRFLTIARTNAKKMTELLDNLLTLSRANRKKIATKSLVNMKELAHVVASDLLKKESNRTIVMDIHDVPSVPGSPTMMRQVLLNILSNAIKFTRGLPHPVIEFGSTMREGEQVFYVRDNGIGFEMRNADKLFDTFQHLHPEETYEGTGVGLAVVRRIIHRYGGRVWAEAEPNKGATIYFTIPTAKNPS